MILIKCVILFSGRIRTVFCSGVMSFWWRNMLVWMWPWSQRDLVLWAAERSAGRDLLETLIYRLQLRLDAVHMYLNENSRPVFTLLSQKKTDNNNFT